MVKVFLFNNGRCAIAYASFCESSDIKILTAPEKKYYGSCASEKRKAEYLTGRILAKVALSRLTTVGKPVSVLKMADGRPRFSEPYENFSLSITHSHNVVVVIVFPSTMNYGIDLEFFNPDYFSAMKYKLRKQFSNVNNLEKATTLWCLKESMCKTGFYEGFFVKQISSNIDFLYKEIGENSIEIPNNVSFSYLKLFPHGVAFVFRDTKWIFTIVKLKED